LHTDKAKILVLDGDMVPALTVARSLKRKGLTIDCASHVCRSISSYSNSVRSSFVYPNPLEFEQEFIDWLLQRIKIGGYHLVIPVTERSILPLMHHRDLFEDSILAMSSNQSLEVVLDKSKTLVLAESLNISIPLSETVHTVGQFERLSSRFNFPIVVKPARSIGSTIKEFVPLAVDYAFDLNELRAKVTHLLLFGSVVLQEYVNGNGVGVEVIADHGKIAYFFQHERMHEMPLTGGGSSLRKGVELTPDLKFATEKLIKALKWHGVAMVEFKLDLNTKSYALMEINGRLWGSLPLAFNSGADFPAMLCELHLSGRVDEHPVPKIGIVCRNLSSDINWHEAVFRKDDPVGLVQFPNLLSVLKDLALIFSFRHRFDVQSLSDLNPGVVDAVRFFSKSLKRLKVKILEKLFFKNQRKQLKSRSFAQKLQDARKILFVCFGNINRSVLAEKVFLELFPNSNVKCISAGFHKQKGRPADPVMLEIAKGYNIDLSFHTSQSVNKDMIETSDIVFVMEKQHWDKVTEMSLPAAKKTFLLGALGGKGGEEIQDPYGKSVVEYRYCFSAIYENINCLKSNH